MLRCKVWVWLSEWISLCLNVAELQSHPSVLLRRVVLEWKRTLPRFDPSPVFPPRPACIPNRGLVPWLSSLSPGHSRSILSVDPPFPRLPDPSCSSPSRDRSSLDLHPGRWMDTAQSEVEGET